MDRAEASISEEEDEFLDPDIDAFIASAPPDHDLDAATPNSAAKRLWIPLGDLPDNRQMRTTYNQVCKYGLSTLKFKPYEWQGRAAAAVLIGHDVVCVARTGDGKSGVFQLLGAKKNSTQIVISPLIGLIEEQVRWW
jgi:ATP-dependent helicase YprA (DUF1998 family)